MYGNLSSAPVVFHFVDETECLLTEDCGKFLLFLDLLFVKDPAELADGVLGVTVEGREVLCGIVSNVNSTGSDGRFRPVLLASPLTGMEMFGIRIYYLLIGLAGEQSERGDPRTSYTRCFYHMHQIIVFQHRAHKR